MAAEFLQLAYTFNKAKHSVAGWYMSEKLDGQRCYWDGGITRGMPKSQVPFANQDKDSRYVETPIATGLWSRYGNVIHAPDSWLDKLPKEPLDGELYNPGYRQDLRAIISRLNPCPSDWQIVQFHVFDSPSYYTIFDPRSIKTTNFKKVFRGETLVWVHQRAADLGIYCPSIQRYELTYKSLLERLKGYDVKLLPQLQLSNQTIYAERQIENRLEEVVAAGGEGLMLRNPLRTYVTQRSNDLLKVKKLDDAEGVVVGCISGKETDLGSKLLGKMGALILDYKGKRLELSGFTDEERAFTENSMINHATQNPGQVMPDWVVCSHFPHGSKVTFKYRGLSKDGIPQEARYWRKRSDS